MAKCMFCKNQTYQETTTIHVVNHEKCIIIIRNVPCLEREQSGEKYYPDQVAEKLERIVDSLKNLMQEIAIVDYATAA